MRDLGGPRLSPDVAWRGAKDNALQWITWRCEEDEGGPGSVDWEILPYLIQVNAHPDLYTLQSCWGHEPGEDKEEGPGYLWIRVRGDCPEPFARHVGGTVLRGREDFPVVEISWPAKSRADIRAIVASIKVWPVRRTDLLSRTQQRGTEAV